MNEHTLEVIYNDPVFLKNREWGDPRPGHSEGTIMAHIEELINNLNILQNIEYISETQQHKLYFLILVHDLFKGEATPKVPITDPRSHASLAREYASQFTQDKDLLNMIQYHDEGYALWRKYKDSKEIAADRFYTLLNTIKDWDLFLMFNIIDGCTEGKDRTPLVWFVNLVHSKLKTTVDKTWIIGQTN